MCVLEEHRSKKLRMTSDVLEQQKRHIEELERLNEILLITQGPGGLKLEMAKEFFLMNQKELLDSMKAKTRTVAETDGLGMLAAVVVNDGNKE